MARVRLCDRCGKYYPSYETSENAVGLAAFNIDNEQVGNATYYDLCPECLEEFRGWLFGPSYTDIPKINQAVEGDCEPHSLSDAIRNAIDVDGIRKALDKQDAKVPEGDFDCVPHYRCPTCFEAVVTYREDPRLPHCQWCGQALDWSEEND